MRVLKWTVIAIVIVGLSWVVIFGAYNSGVKRRVGELKKIEAQLVSADEKVEHLVNEYNQRIDSYQEDSDALSAIKVNILQTIQNIDTAHAIRKRINPYNPDSSTYLDNLSIYRYLATQAEKLNESTEQKLKEYDENLKNAESPK
ncbi:MAG: hypothetical protein Q7S83_02320 [bacterium]|nr:hypothetical protein [bacterium]